MGRSDIKHLLAIEDPRPGGAGPARPRRPS